MNRFRLSTLFYTGALLVLAACQPGPGQQVGNLSVSNQSLASRSELPILVEYEIPTANAHASGITVGSDGALWFAETGANQIGRISTDGTITEYPVLTKGAMEDAQGIVGLGPDGAIWFSEDRANKLGRITPEGTVSEYDLPPGTAPVAEIVGGTDGALWVTAVGANAILKLSTEGEVLAKYPLPIPNSLPAGMVAGPDGAFWFVEKTANQIGRITLDGTLTEYPIPTAKGTPIRLTVGPDGALWFNMIAANKVGRIDLAGEVTEYAVPGMGPLGLAAGADGAVWFTGYSSGEIGRLTTGGVLTKLSVPTKDAVPYRMVAGPDGSLWFTEQQGNKIGQVKLPAGAATAAALTAAAKQKPTSAANKFSPNNFELPMTLDLGSPWRVSEDYPDVFTLASEPNLVDIGFITVNGAQIAGPADPFAVIPFPQGFATWIESHGLFQVVATQPTAVGGFRGTQIDAIGTAGCGHRKSWIFPSTGTGWNCTDGQHFRFSYFPDVHGESLLILSTGARTDDRAAVEFKQGTEAAQLVLDTVLFSVVSNK